ncbi:DUF1294 domain-containing protein [Irregularibacter muris]|uniref:DUF1294 domain-containing protein n=1 Tax=Irregularibacter muris TaxID=1796619 RepID=A0AAE3HDU3_9FIRM|nr:DUF1294 domain-containing protein [Irregularibacter muris]MCR1897620.1 DUF1294 domain-containing protein [Irregularibacter muris]
MIYLQDYKYIIFFYYLGINVYSLLLMGIDKRRARKHQWRISERHLMSMALLGGACGILLGMKFYQHKTKHKLFYLGSPILLFLHILFILYLTGFFSW